MEPTEPTSESLDNLARHGETTLRAELLSAADRVRALVPELVGLSLTKYDREGPITLVATTPDVLPLDAVQYVADGPCVESARTAETIHAARLDPLDEQRWSFFARVAAEAGVQSSLSLPLMDADVVVGSANLYASVAKAFTGRVEAVAEVVEGWAPGAVLDADLSFATRRDAVRTSADLERRDYLVHRATQIIARLTGGTVEEALATMVDSAARAGITLAQFARTVVVFHD